MREAATPQGRAKALAGFLGASVALHGFLAWGLMQAGLAQVTRRPAEPLPPPVELESVWLGGSSQAPDSSPKPRAASQQGAPVAAAPRKHKAVVAAPVRPVAQAPASPIEPAAISAPLTSIALPSAQAAPGASVAETAASPSEEGAPGSRAAASTEGASASGVGSREAEAAESAGSKGLELGAYARLLSQAVARQRHYPPSAARLGMEGTAHVQLRVRLDGSLMEPPRLVRSSGQEVLDTEALRMVEAAAPFEPMPQALSRPSAGFVIPVVFSLHSGT